MFENLIKLYSHYGGARAVLKSGYFWISLLLAVLSCKSIESRGWADKAVGVLPSLTGFTIAAFAIIFAILSPEMLRRLMAADDYGRSPIAEIAASIGHAVSIQVLALILAVSSDLVELTSLSNTMSGWMHSMGYSPEPFILSMHWLSLSVSAAGLFSLYYGVMLVLATILSIVRMQLIVSAATRAKPATTKRPPKVRLPFEH